MLKGRWGKHRLPLGTTAGLACVVGAASVGLPALRSQDLSADPQNAATYGGAYGPGGFGQPSYGQPGYGSGMNGQNGTMGNPMAGSVMIPGPPARPTQSARPSSWPGGPKAQEADDPPATPSAPQPKAPTFGAAASAPLAGPSGAPTPSATAPSGTAPSNAAPSNTAFSATGPTTTPAAPMATSAAPRFGASMSAAPSSPAAPVGANGSPGPYAPLAQPPSFGPMNAAPAAAGNSTAAAGQNPAAPGAAVQAPAHAFETKVEAPRLTGTEKVAQVGTEWILAGEILPVVDEIIEMHKHEISPEELEPLRLAQLRQRLPGMIETKMIYVDAKKKIPKEAWTKITPQVDKMFDSINVPQMMDAYKVSTRGQLEEVMRKHNTSIEAQRQAFLERSVASQWVHQQVKDNYVVSHEEALQYYYAHIAEYKSPPRARWEHIRVRFKKHASKEEAGQLIADYGNQVMLQGAKFADVAKAHSEDNSAEEGGYHDWTTKGSLASRALDAAIFTLPVGALSEIIVDDIGLSIVRVIEREAETCEPFTAKQLDIKKKIKDEHLQMEQDAYLKKLRERTPVWTMFDPPPTTNVASGGPAAANPQR